MTVGVQAMIVIVFSVSRLLLLTSQYKSLLKVWRYVSRRDFGSVFSCFRRCKVLIGVFAVLAVSQGMSNENTIRISTIVVNTLVYTVTRIMLAGLTSKVKLIAQRFSLVIETSNQRVRRKLGSEPYSIQQQDLLRKYYFWKYVQQEFENCIALHVKFFAMKTRMALLLNVYLSIVFYSIAASVIPGLFYLNQHKNISAETISYIIWLCYEYLTLTHLATLLRKAVCINWEINQIFFII